MTRADCSRRVSKGISFTLKMFHNAYSDMQKYYKNAHPDVQNEDIIASL
jgi:hypothetical protein